MINLRADVIINKKKHCCKWNLFEFVKSSKMSEEIWTISQWKEFLICVLYAKGCTEREFYCKIKDERKQNNGGRIYGTSPEVRKYLWQIQR